MPPSADRSPETSPSPAPRGATAQPTFEQALERLETIVESLEDGQTSLQQSLAQYEEGVRLLRQCYELLDGAQRKIELLSRLDADGNPVVEPFDDTSSLEADEGGSSRSRRRSKPTPPKRKSEPAMDEEPGLF